jgi:hypothetical protein
VQFVDATTNTPLGSAALSSGTATLTTAALNAGTHVITATYAGNTTFLGSSAVLTLTVLPSILVLNPTANGALSLSGNASINIPANLVVDSSSKTALTENGNASIQAASIQVVGGVSQSGNATLSPAAVTGAASVPDPLAGLTGPGTTGLTSYGPVSFSSGAHMLCPGIYNQISATGNASLTLSPGLYLIEGGGFTVTGNASVTGTGVTIYNTGSNYPNAGGNFGGITLSANGSFSLSAAASAANGAYPGIVIFQAHANTRALALGGNAAAGIAGTIYAPAAQVIVSGNAQLNGALDVNKLTLSGNGVSTQVADGTGGSSIDSASYGTLLAGNLEVYVSDPAGYFTANEQARIQDAINAWDTLLAPYNVVITEVSDPALANVVIDTGTTSPAGAAADGVLGSYSSTGEITILQGWSWYDGADPSQIGANQYDFQTVVTHELGHALGLGGSNDPGSPMNEVLPAGVVRRTPGVADLNILEPAEGADPERAAGFHHGENTASPFEPGTGNPAAALAANDGPQGGSGSYLRPGLDSSLLRNPGDAPLVVSAGNPRTGLDAVSGSGTSGSTLFAGLPAPATPTPARIRDQVFESLGRRLHSTAPPSRPVSDNTDRPAWLSAGQSVRLKAALESGIAQASAPNEIFEGEVARPPAGSGGWLDTTIPVDETMAQALLALAATGGLLVREDERRAIPARPAVAFARD